MSLAYEISTVQDSIIIKVPRNIANEKTLARFLDFLDMENIRQKSQMTKENALKISKDVKQGAWEQVKNLFEDK
ncbi:hypothetical protein QUF70_09535 [Desulfobacterales bacterium HSG17]|nr:hypothetical protein [Desulfobacterales bacterium HSG17]